VSETLRVLPHRIWRVFNHWINKAKDSLADVREIGIDETSIKKGHNYVTIVADLNAKRTVFVTKGKDASTVEEFAQTLANKGGSVNNIITVSMDMSPAYISGVGKHFPDAQIVFDKFHIVKMLHEAMDDMRKLERKGNEQLRGHKYSFLRAFAKLKKQQQSELQLLIESYPKLSEAYRLKELFNDVWYIKEPDEAKGYVQFWCELVNESGIYPFINFVKTLKSHWSGIVAYFDKKISNALLESINAKVQLAKKRARGYRNINNYINMIYFLTAKLKFDYPH
jgi:transposase